MATAAETMESAPWRARVAWAALLAATLSVVALSAGLTPSESGVGTHTQLGLPPCGFLQLAGIPCPACGLTTAFAHLARFQLELSLRAHPLGLPLGLLLIGVAARALRGLVMAESISIWLSAPAWPRLALGLSLILLGVWAVRLLTAH